MSDIQYVNADPELFEVRSMEERLIEGRIVPFGETIKFRGRSESFAKGSLSHIDPKNTVLLHMHDQSKLIGRMTALEERQDGAYATFKVAKTDLGNEVLQLAHEGVLNSFSLGFIPGEQSSDGIHRRIASLPEVSLVTFGAYEGANILAVRNSELKEEILSENTNETVAIEATLEATDAPDYEKRFSDIDASLAKLQTVNFIPEKQDRALEVRPVDWFVGEVYATFRNDTSKREAVMEALEKRAIDDAVGTFGGASTTASGLIENDYLGDQIVNVLDGSRPFFRRAGKLAMPKSGSALIPTVTQHNLAAVRASQAAEPESRDLRVVTNSYTAKWYDSSLQVSYELMATAEFDVLALVFNDMLRAYGLVTEAAFITDVEAAITTYHTGGIALTNYGTMIVDVVQGSEVIRAATGAPMSHLAVPLADWPTYLTFVESASGYGRRIFNGQDGNDPAVGLTAEALVLPGGIEVFPAGVTKAIGFNADSLKNAEAAPIQLEAVNIAQVTKDVAILGRTLVVPRIPGGIVYFDTEPSSSSS